MIDIEPQAVDDPRRPAEAQRFRSAVRTSLFLEAAAVARGVNTLRVSTQGFTAGSAPTYSEMGFYETLTTESSRAAVRTCEDRLLRKIAFSEAGIPVPRSRSFGFRQAEEAVQYAARFRRGVLVKPRSVEAGRVSRRRIEGTAAVEEAIQSWRPVLGGHGTYLVEQRAVGREYSFYVVGATVVSVVRRRNGGWREEVYRAGSDGFGEVHPEIFELAVAAFKALPAMPHGSLRMMCQGTLTEPGRCVVVSASPEMGLVGRHPPEEWGLFLADAMVCHAARNLKVAVGSAGEAVDVELLMTEVDDPDQLAASISEWCAAQGVVGRAESAGSREVTTSLHGTPGEAVALSGLAKTGRLDGGAPLTVSVQHRAAWSSESSRLNRLSCAGHIGISGGTSMLPEPGEFVLDRQAQRIGIKSALMEYAALRRRLKVTRVSRQVVVVDAPSGQQLAFANMNGPLSSQVGRYFCDRKEHGRERLAAAGLRVTLSELFSYRAYTQALEFARSLDAPTVVKPTRMARGRGITTGIETDEQFRHAWDVAFGAYRRPEQSQVLVERQIPGEDYRLYAIGHRVVLATHRKRANVTGDGQSTISELIAQKNAERSQNPYLGGYSIPTGIDQLDRLPRRGWTLDHVPVWGEEVTLRGASNLSAGGDSIDFTDVLHPGFREIAIRAVEAVPGMEYGGVDIIAPSITVEPTPDNHVISEVEYSPAPITHFPAAGKPHDMAGELLEFYLEQAS